MYENIDKSTEYFCLNNYTNEYFKVGNKQNLIEFIKKNLDSNFSQLNMSLKDVYRDETYYNENRIEVKYYLRKYTFFDGFYRIIDIRELRNDIFSYKVQKVFYVKKKFQNSWKFREDPVPGTGKVRKRYFLRKIKTTQERRMNCDPEMVKYVRPARRYNNIPNSYDDIWREYYKGWKDCTKKKKQWM